ncbi:MAG TPA: AAA family ATPase [Pseudolabrys sp.]|jgi:hypothetical protein
MTKPKLYCVEKIDARDSDYQDRHDEDQQPPMTIDSWIERDLSPPDILMGPFSTSSRVILNAETGLGKTNFALALSAHIAAGRDFLHWKCKRPANVLFIDGEMSRRVLRDRIKDAVRRIGKTPTQLYILSHEDVHDFQPINTPAGAAIVERQIARIGKVDMIVFDNIMSLTSGDLKDEESWKSLQPFIRSLTARNISQLWIHHTGYDASHGYGTKTREWAMDTVIQASKINRPDTDISFSLSFPKARERSPANRADYQDINVALVRDQWSYDAADRTATKQKLSTKQTLARNTLSDLVNESGMLAPGSLKLPPSVRVAKLDDWRVELFSRGVLDAESKNPRTDFARLKDALQAKNVVGLRSGYIWLIAK